MKGNNLIDNTTENINTRVVDAVMGSGKTNAIIEYINQATHPTIIIVERQSEVDRLSSACPNLVSLSDVSDETGISRAQALEDCTDTGLSIVSTHQLMRRWSNRFLLSVERFRYELIIDETLSGVLTQVGVKTSDLNQYLDSGHIQQLPSNEFKKVSLEKPLHSKYNSLESTINNKDCYLFDMYSDESDESKYALIEAPRSEMFEVFTKITVLTYLFEGSLLRSYFDLHNINYDKFSIVDGVIDYYSARNGSAYKELIVIYQGKHNRFHCKRGHSREGLSKTWSEKSPNQSKTAKALRNVFNSWSSLGCTSESFAYTFHKDYQERVHTSYVGSSKSNRQYHNINERKSMSNTDKRKVTFLPQTIRGTNDFSHKQFMAYLPNTFMNPVIQNFLREHDLVVNEETFALSQMIQWLWRGCIRNCNLPQYHRINRHFSTKLTSSINFYL